MFTGIIEDKGIVKELRRAAPSVIVVKTAITASEIKNGDSISINGACLTVIRINGDILTFDVSPETFNVTALKRLKVNDTVNLERAVKVGGRFDGHIVSGHIDGIGKIVGKKRMGDFFVVRVSADKELLKHIVKKGSIAVDGISLTVNGVDDAGFDFVVIPHTYKMTNLNEVQSGAAVNIETDILAKYVEKLLKNSKGDAKSKVNASFLAEHGFF